MTIAPLTTAQQLQQLQTQLQALARLEASDVSSLSSRVTNIENDLSLAQPASTPAPSPASIPIPTPPAPAPVAPVFIAPGGASFTDGQGIIWAILSSGAVTLNGSTANNGFAKVGIGI